MTRESVGGLILIAGFVVFWLLIYKSLTTVVTDIQAMEKPYVEVIF